MNVSGDADVRQVAYQIVRLHLSFPCLWFFAPYFLVNPYFVHLRTWSLFSKPDLPPCPVTYVYLYIPDLRECLLLSRAEHRRAED